MSVFSGAVQHVLYLLKKPLGVRGAQSPEASIGFGDLCGKSAKPCIAWASLHGSMTVM